MKTCKIIILCFLAQICFGQTNLSFNQGGTDQKNYYSTIPYENVNEKIIVKVKIKEKLYRFILDTGAPTSISSKLFEELKPNTISKQLIGDVNMVKDSMMVVSLDNISVGDVIFKNVPTLVIKPNLIFDCLQADGFIGSNLLRNSIINIDNKSKQIIITGDAKKLNLNTKQSSKLFLDNQSSPYISIRLENKKKGKQQLLFDTGMNGLYDLSFRELGILQASEIFDTLAKTNGSNSWGINGFAKDTTQYRLRLPVMEINGTKLLNITTETTIDQHSRIGAKLLEYGVVTVDYKNKKFYFDPFIKIEFDAHEAQFPLAFIPRDNKIFVSAVWDKLLVEKIKIGDQIIAIDDLNLENINACELFVKPISKGKSRVLLITKNSEGEKIELFIEKK